MEAKHGPYITQNYKCVQTKTHQNTTAHYFDADNTSTGFQGLQSS